MGFLHDEILSRLGLALSGGRSVNGSLNPQINVSKTFVFKGTKFIREKKRKRIFFGFFTEKKQSNDSEMGYIRIHAQGFMGRT